jgi:hypothetical protein
MNGINEIVKQGTFGGNGRRDTFVFYDRITLAATAKDYPLFANAQGQVDPITSTVKTFSDTNLVESKKIPQGQRFDIHKIKLNIKAPGTLTAAAKQALFDYINSTVLTIQFTNFANTLELPLDMLYGAALLTVDGVTERDSAAFNLAEGEFLLKANPIQIAENITFTSRLVSDTNPDAALAGVKIKISYEGVLFRVN